MSPSRPTGLAEARTERLLAKEPLYGSLGTSGIRHLTLNDVRDLQAGRLHLPARTITLAEPVRVRLAAYLAHRHRRWPNTANPHFFVTSRTALSTVPVSHPWLYRQYPASSDLLRADRILDEVRSADGDVPMICELFGLSVQAATRYTSTGGLAAG